MPFSREEIERLGLPILGLFIEDPRKPGWFHPLITPDTSKLEPWQKQRFDALYTDFFYHRHNAFWARNAMKKLPKLLSCTGMLACGEDLGMVPDCVPGVMDHEKILSLEMQRMEKGRPWPYLSVVATSSHDMTSIRLWNGNDKTPEECRNILKAHLDACSMLAIFPLQDWLSMEGSLRWPNPAEERINDPADPDNKWCWRMHLTTGQLLDNAAFCEEVAALVKGSGR
jgi:4-alpha-glucanotransferase